MNMHRTFAGTLAALALCTGSLNAHAQVAGSTLVGLGIMEVREVAHGVSARKQILNQQVVNESGETVGRITDVIITPDASVSYAIVSAGGFLGVRRHDVAIAVSLFQVSDTTLVLPGATREAIKGMPAFEYAR